MNEHAKRLRGQAAAFWAHPDDAQICREAADLLTRYAKLERAAREFRDAVDARDECERRGTSDTFPVMDYVGNLVAVSDAMAALRAALAELEQK